MVLKKPPATYAEIEALPDNVVGEIIDGELFVQPRPAIPHASFTKAGSRSSISRIGKPRIAASKT